MVADRSSNMDLSLEDIIKTTQPMRRGAGMARGRAQGKTRGVVRRTTIRQITSRGALMRGGPTGTMSRGVGFMSRGRAPSRGPIHISTQSLRNNMNTYNQPDAMTMGPAKLVITNLDHGVTDNDIRELFGEFGSTSEAAIHYDRTGKSLSTGHVIFKRHMDAVKAHKQYNGVNLDGRPMQIVIEPLTNNRGGNSGRGGLMGDAPGMNMNMPFGGRGGGLMGVSPGMNNMNRNNMPYNNSSQGGYNNNFPQRGYNNSSQGGYMGAHSRLQQPPSLMGGNTGSGGGLMGAAPDMNTNMPYSGRGGGLMGAAPAFNNMNSNNMTPSSGGYMGGQGILQQPSAFMSGGYGGNNFQNSGRLNFNSGRGNYQGNYQGNMSGGFNTPYNNSGNRGSFRGRSMMGSRGGMTGRGSFQARGGGFTGTRGNRGVTRGFGGGRGAGGRPVKKTPTAAELDAELDSYLKEQAS